MGWPSFPEIIQEAAKCLDQALPASQSPAKTSKAPNDFHAIVMKQYLSPSLILQILFVRSLIHSVHGSGFLIMLFLLADGHAPYIY